MKDSMRLDTEPGRKVKVISKDGKVLNGYTHHQEQVLLYLKLNKAYTVKEITVGDWSSTVEFKEVPGQRFNTVCFYNFE